VLPTLLGYWARLLRKGERSQLPILPIFTLNKLETTGTSGGKSPVGSGPHLLARF